MKKSILKLGKALKKADQKEVFGGAPSLSCYGKSPGSSCGTSTGYVCCYPRYTTDYLYCTSPSSSNCLLP